VLLSSCDVAALGTALGLLFGWARVVGVAFLFQVAVGLPAFVVGLFTTFHPNVTSFGVHTLPVLAGGWLVGRRGLPRGAAVAAFVVNAAVLVASYYLAPPELNLDLLRQFWSPVARALPSPVAYYGAFMGAVLEALVLGELGTRAALRLGRRARGLS